MVEHLPDITAETEPEEAAEVSAPSVLRMATAILAHGGLGIGLGLLVGGLAGPVIGTGVGLIWFFAPPLALSASLWLQNVADWDAPIISSRQKRPQAPPLPRGEDTSTADRSAA